MCSRQLRFFFLGICLLTALPSQAVKQPAQSSASRGIVASAHPLATAAGLSILRQGGNAVDAAVATTLAISVVEPFSAGIGGGGFLLYRPADTGKVEALDFREKAPLKATATMYLDVQGKVRPRASTDGYLAVAVPGSLAGLAEVQHRYGRLPWSATVQPAIALAEQGFTISDHLARATQSRLPLFKTNAAARAIFTQQGQPLKPGTKLIQRDLGRTLQLIAQDPDRFYTGTIAQAIARDMQRNQGLITLDDLKTYRPTWRSPVCGAFLKMQVCSMPPPSSGGVHLLELLNLWSASGLQNSPRYSPKVLHFMAEAMKIAYADRAVHLGDPGFVKVPVSALINPAYAAQRRLEITDKARPASEVNAASQSLLQRYTRSESTETSHLSVVDKDRNAVSLTFTVNLGFGAGVVAAGTGIVLNNEMDDFAIAPNTPNAFGLVGSQANAIAPGKIPLSSMTPTIVSNQGRLKLVAGSPGGSTIITTVFQLVLNTLIYGMNAEQAVSATRIHDQWLPDQLRVEAGLDNKTLDALRQRGHTVVERPSWGNADLILVKSDGTLEGAADPRGEGSAQGY